MVRWKVNREIEPTQCFANHLGIRHNWPMRKITLCGHKNIIQNVVGSQTIYLFWSEKNPSNIKKFFRLLYWCDESKHERDSVYFGRTESTMIFLWLRLTDEFYIQL